MGRIITILTIWLGGFLFGFIGWYAYPYIGNLMQTLMPIVLNIVDIQITSALLTGFATSIITVVIVVLWANRDKNNRF